ncbi:MAG: DUF5020 family protein [Bacteroidales bacterium]|nr:DUF5020 family protein [Bacteroidales bacterium]
MKKVFASLLLAAAVLAGAQTASAQTDVRALYNIYGSDTPGSLWLESWGTDSWGDTFFQGGFGMQTGPLRPVGGRIELARDFNLWQEVPVLKDFSIHTEYNAILNMGNSNWLFGISYTVPVEKHLLRATVSYKTFNGSASSLAPVQVTLMWRMKDLFGAEGLEFRGLAKGWGEVTRYWYAEEKPSNGMMGLMIFTANPQIWYAFGRFINFDGLSIGTELEFSYHWLGCFGFRFRPSAGLKLSF